MPRPPKEVVISKQEIGDRVRALRLAREMTQAQLADILGTRHTNVSGIERGMRGLTIQQLVKLARALDVSPAEILDTKRRKGTNGHLPRRFERFFAHAFQIHQTIVRFYRRQIRAYACSRLMPMKPRPIEPDDVPEGDPAARLGARHLDPPGRAAGHRQDDDRPGLEAVDHRRLVERERGSRLDQGAERAVEAGQPRGGPPGRQRDAVRR